MTTWLRRRTGISPGRHGYPKGTVQQSQRVRLMASAAELAAEDGFRGVTSRRLVDRAGVSQATLYELFGSKDDCCHAAADDALEHLLALMEAAAAASRASASERLERIVGTWMRFCDDYPAPTRLALTEIAAAGPRGIEMREAALLRIEELLRGPIGEAYPRAPRMAPAFVTGALCELAAKRLREGRGGELEELGPTVVAELLGRRVEAAA